MKILLSTIVVIGLTACNQTKPKSDTKTMDFGAFTIETPQSWQQIKARGADSYVGRIAIDEKDTLDFDLGWYSNTLSESDPAIIDRSMLQHFEQIGQPLDTSDMIIVESRKGIDPDKYKKQNVSWTAKQILFSAGVSWVFGGMGSWNDLGFESKKDNETYDRLSEQLYSNINQAIIAATNSY